MEDGVKGDTAKPKEAKFTGKEGWVKKSSGKFLASYKDRYIRVENTEIVIYENEDLKSCLERVDLENYEKCHELRSAFKKRNRLILIRAPKCANKIQDVKIQAQNPEEKEAWIKALSDGICRAKNKIFDEVKVDESCSLEHVTRTRPKGNQGRRPPTRIHMKEVANLSSDGILRMDLDASDSTPNGTHQVNTEVDASKKAVKPPMPPSKPSESSQETPEAEPTPPKKVLKPPMPPSKENKPNSPVERETPKEVEPPDSKPPNKASYSSEEPDNTTPSQSPPPISDPVHPPMPPSKDKKPAQTVEWEIPPPSQNAKDSEEGSPEETSSNDQGKTDSDELGNKGDSVPSHLMTSIKEEESDETSAKMEDSCPVLSAPVKEGPDHSSVALEAEGNPAPAISLSADTLKPAASLTKSTEPSPQPAKKNPGPPAPPKKKPASRSEGNQNGAAEGPVSAESRDACPPNESVSKAVISDPSEHKDGLTPTVEPKKETKALSTGDTVNVAVFPDLTVPKMKQEESSNDDLQGGDSEGAPTVRDDRSEAEEEPAEGHVSQKGKVVKSARSQVQMPKHMQTKRGVQTKQGVQLIPTDLPLKPSMGKSASLGDLLSESEVPGRQWAVQEISRTSPRNDTNELHSKVEQELEDTVELLDSLCSEQEAQGSVSAKEGPKGLSPEELLTKAVEKLRKADQFLQVAKSLKRPSSLEKKHRMSW